MTPLAISADKYSPEAAFAGVALRRLSIVAVAGVCEAPRVRLLGKAVTNPSDTPSVLAFADDGRSVGGRRRTILKVKGGRLKTQ
jgi:hypothetical protein